MINPLGSHGPIARTYDEPTTTEQGTRRRPGVPSRKRPDGAVELVVVHGMGRQQRLETLYEWAEPLLRRIEWLSESVTFDGVGPTIGSDEETISAWVDYTDLTGAPRRLHLTISEARWAEAFIALKRTEVFTWGMGFVWKTFLRLGAHFSRVFSLGVLQLLSRFGYHKPTGTERSLGWLRALGFIPLVLLGSLTLAFLGSFWLLLAAVAVLAVVLLPLVTVLMYVPGIKRMIQGVVGVIVDFVGDVATWKRRPVRAAAMRQVVRNAVGAAARRLDSRKSKGAKRIILLAHSQGAAVSAQLLFDDQDGPPPKVGAFVSVGAAVTLLGASRLGTQLRARFRASILRREQLRLPSPMSNPVERWAANHPDTEWLNFWGIWDPFAAGTIGAGPVERVTRWWAAYRRPAPVGGPIGPEEHPVHNTSSPLTDHQSYASNIAQVVDPVARLILDVRPGPVLTAQPAGAAALTARARHESSLLRSALHARSVKGVGLNRLLILAIAVFATFDPAFLTAIGTTLRNWTAFLLTMFGRARDGLGGAVESIVSGEDAETAAGVGLVWTDLALTLAGVAGLLGLAIAALWLNAKLWRGYIHTITWLPQDELTNGDWISGVLARAVLCAVVVLQAYLGLVTLEADPVWLVSGPILVALGMLLVFVSPWLAREPRVVPARRVAGDDPAHVTLRA